MKYYSFKPCGVETTKFCEPRFFGEWEGEFLWMNLWENRELKLPVTMSVKNKYNPGDYPLADSKLVSQRLFDIIKQLNKDYEALPTQLYYKEKEQIWDIYYSMIFPEYEAFNFEKSCFHFSGYFCRNRRRFPFLPMDRRFQPLPAIRRPHILYRCWCGVIRFCYFRYCHVLFTLPV